MTARDFRDEQFYFLARLRLHERVFHGAGIVCGLEVVLHPDPTCQAQGWVVITPGIAYDCFGRELIVRQPQVVNVTQLFLDKVPCGCEKQFAKATDPTTDPGPTATSTTTPLPEYPPAAGSDFLIGLRYGELCIEPVPVLVDETGCGQRTTPNRIQETACVRYRLLDDPANSCWGPPKIHCNQCPPPASPMPKPIPPSLEDVLAPLCHCGTLNNQDTGFIPLAKCSFQTSVAPKLDLSGRRHLNGPLHPNRLTHICSVNWNHGGCMTMTGDQLTPCQPPGPAPKTEAPKTQSPPDGGEHPHRQKHLRLEFTFDGQLANSKDLLGDSDHDPTGFYRRILQVRYVTETGDLRAIPRWGRATLDTNRTKLTYEIPLGCLHELQEHVRDPIIVVTLNCDFLPDHCGRAVDGNHLNGSLAWDSQGKPKGPTGDGIAGGLFESWFQLHWWRNHGQ